MMLCFVSRQSVLALSLSGLAALWLPAAYALGLQDAYQAALGHDPKFRAAQKDLEASAESRAIGRSYLLPEVTFGASRGRNALDRTVGRTSDSLNYDSSSAALQLRQPLFNREFAARYRQGEVQARYGEVQFAIRNNELILRMLEAYTNLLLTYEQVNLAEAQASAYAEQLRSSERAFKLGEGTQTDVLEARASHQLALAQIIEARGGLDNAASILSGIIGPDLKAAPRHLGRQFDFVKLDPDSLDKWQVTALDRSSEIELRRQVVRNASEQLAIATAAQYPRLDLTASISRSESDSINTINQTNAQKSIGLQLNVPLYSGGRTSAQVRQSEATLGRAEAELADITQEIEVELRRQFNALQGGAQRIDALGKALDSATLLIEATRKSVLGGVRVTLDVLNAEQRKYTVERDLAQARFTYLQAWLRLRSAAGLLQPDDLAAMEGYLSPGSGAYMPMFSKP